MAPDGAFYGHLNTKQDESLSPTAVSSRRRFICSGHLGCLKRRKIDTSDRTARDLKASPSGLSEP